MLTDFITVLARFEKLNMSVYNYLEAITKPDFMSIAVENMLLFIKVVLCDTWYI